MIKLISLDLDGTALNPEGRLSSAVKAAIAKARAAGVRVIFNTGRPAPEAFAFIREAETDRSSAGGTWPSPGGGERWRFVWAGMSS